MQLSAFCQPILGVCPHGSLAYSARMLVNVIGEQCRLELGKVNWNCVVVGGGLGDGERCGLRRLLREIPQWLDTVHGGSV